MAATTTVRLSANSTRKLTTPTAADTAQNWPGVTAAPAWLSHT